MKCLKRIVVVEELKRQFEVHGIPEKGVSDNGPQLSNSEFQEFAKSLLLSTSNFASLPIEATRAIHTVKNLF